MTELHPKVLAFCGGWELQGLKSLCENSEISPSAAKAALNFRLLRHG